MQKVRCSDIFHMGIPWLEEKTGSPGEQDIQTLLLEVSCRFNFVS